jgi:hypothetical protein
MLILFFNTLSMVSFKVRGKGSLALTEEVRIRNSETKYKVSLMGKLFFMNRWTPKRKGVETIIFKGFSN